MILLADRFRLGSLCDVLGRNSVGEPVFVAMNGFGTVRIPVFGMWVSEEGQSLE